MKPKMTKDVVPDNFTMGLVLSDLVPVIFFGLNIFMISLLFKSRIFIAGAVLCFLAGFLKVVWKFIVVIAKKNVWPLFVQLRILMPAGFLMIILSIFVDNRLIIPQLVVAAVTTMPQRAFFTAGFAGMLLMCVFPIVLNSRDVKSNWIEQIVNGLSQIAIFVGLLLI